MSAPLGQETEFLTMCEWLECGVQEEKSSTWFAFAASVTVPEVKLIATVFPLRILCFLRFLLFHYKGTVFKEKLKFDLLADGCLLVELKAIHDVLPIPRRL